MPSQKTPPPLKWLLNERAVLAGHLATASKLLPALMRKRAAVGAQLSQLQAHVESLESAQDTLSRKIAALSSAIRQFDDTVDPAAAGIVLAQAGRYGRWGGKRAFCLQYIRGRCPGPVATGELVRAVEESFGLIVVARRYRNNLLRGMRRDCLLWVQRGLIEQVPGDDSRGNHFWRWKGAPTLDDIRKQAPAGDPPP